MSVDGLNSTVVAWGVAADAQLQAQEAQAGEQAAKNRLALMEINNMGSSSSGSAAAAQLIEEKKKTDQLLKRNTALGTELAALREALAERDKLVLEWMHSDEAYKRLSKKFGKKIGLSDEEFTDERVAEILDISEENPEFSNTKLQGKASVAKEKKIATKRPIS